jgi:dTDP-4-dehydrorhamnose reductase
MRVLVTGTEGQVVRAMRERARPGLEIQAVGRPDLDLEKPEALADVVERIAPDAVVSAAAYTAVDAAEQEQTRAFTVNSEGAGALSAAAARIGAPIVHLSTDYVFDGAKPAPYREDDPTGPATVYGASKLAGEIAVAEANPAHVILRTAWVYAPFGQNFVRTMLRLAETRDEVSVVSDQLGNPTYALDIADGVFAVLDRLKAGGRDGFGIFHMVGTGETSWAGFAEAVFEGSARRGGPSARVKPIATAAYPTPAPRPANSRLDCAKLERVYGVRLPTWRESLERCLDRLIGPARSG